MNLTHAELVQRSVKWLRSKGCKIVLAEVVALTTETPDAIGWRGACTYLIEAKASRADFLADRKKPFRRAPQLGMGAYRYFICPPGIIRTDELPKQWGLLYAHKKSVSLEAGDDPRSWNKSGDFSNERSTKSETIMLLSALNRLRLHHGDAEFNRLVHATYASKHPKPNPESSSNKLDAWGTSEPPDATGLALRS